MALEGLRRLFEKQDSTAELRRAHEQQLTELYVEIGKLTTQVAWLKKVTTLTRQERVALIERAEGELPLRLQADLLSLSRLSLYYQPLLPSAEEVRLKHRIDEVYTQSPFYGSRKIAAQLYHVAHYQGFSHFERRRVKSERWHSLQQGLTPLPFLAHVDIDATIC